MADKKVEITQDMCRQAQLMIKGGATNKEAASLLGVSPATVSRIRSANYDLFKYQQNTEARRSYKLPAQHGGTFHKWVYTAEGMKFIEVKAEELVKNDLQEEKKDDQVPGQMEMDLPTYPQIKETDMNKLMRFLAGKIGEITTKLDKLNDNLCQILRRMDK